MSKFINSHSSYLFQAWCCKHMLQHSLLGLLQHFLLWKLLCHRGGGWPEWGPTGPCAGCTGPCGNTSWLSTANLCCSDDANTGISDGTALVIVNIWNLIWTWYSLKEHCLEFGPWSPHLGIWVPMVTYFFTFPIFSISGFRMRWKLIEQPLSNVDHLISCENKDYLLGSSCNTRHYTTVHI